MPEYLFVRRERAGKTGWWLKLSSEEEIIRFLVENRFFDGDREHFEKIRNALHDDRTAVTHSEFGFCTDICRRLYGFDDVSGSYGMLRAWQALTIVKLFRETGAAYVNRKMGVCGENSEFTQIGFVRKSVLEFPQYHDDEIRIRRFPDGSHYYAYIGDAQVRDGDVLKWDTYDEAYAQALRYSSTKPDARKKTGHRKRFSE